MLERYLKLKEKYPKSVIMIDPSEKSLGFLYIKCQIIKKYGFSIYKANKILYNNGSQWLTVGKSGDNYVHGSV